MNVKDEKGASQIIENVIVLPVVFMTILFILYWGQVQYQKAVIVSAAERGIIYLEQDVTDYSYEKLAAINLEYGASDVVEKDINTKALTNNVNREPYRYISGLFSHGNYSSIENYIKGYIEKKQVFFHSTVSVKIKEETGLYKKLTITIKQDLDMPDFFKTFGLDNSFEYKYKAVGYASQPTEIIRNMDFVMELLQPYINVLQYKLNDLVEKLNKVFDKISILNGMGK